MKFPKVCFPFLILLFLNLVLLNLVPLAHAGVGLEYLGPNPLRPQPVSGEPNTLGAGAIIGNTGNENATVTFTLVADPDFNNQFTYSVSDNNFSLSPSTRMNFAIFFAFNPNSISVKDYSAAIKITASPTSKSGTSGSASFDLAVAISADVLSIGYTGVQITLTTSTGVRTVTTMTTPNTESLSTTSTPETNSLYTNSLPVDPNLLVGAAIGVVAILTVLVVSRRRRPKRGDVGKVSISEPLKATTKPSSTKNCVSCGADIRLNDKFCDYCGANQGQ